MKKFLFLHTAGVFVLFVSAGVGASFAQDVSTSNEGRLRMEERMEAREERMENREDDGEIRMMKQREDTEGRYQEMRARFQERRDAVLIRQEEARESMKVRHGRLSQEWQDRHANLSERRKQNIKNHTERIIQRMEQAVERLGGMADKIEDRLSRLEDTGVDVTTLISILQEARSAIARADTTLDAAVAELRAAPDAGNPADALGKARALLEDVKAALREAHVALVEIVVEIKKGQLVSESNKNNE
ncbi:MAG: hypothetical protein A3J54_03565 [Candidatus Ryanbacteria bacterium RIFCSPHIGHO2_02_FULL_45_13b]|uniref:DUF5667 domain-containing protein n=1 Tax=Candidatus Ryanbacteria bacterium RIFCSPHIGHO2_02_FULL_45_13b TaxID=1802117 RepID=A0A1G2G4J2_9BACT|nr:MAG: hypothetical protein A3J54_03565 [Candidatus Ryanbacteria bacterium RIFCSPHIGHO2_02_FULL_45_13b]